MSGTASNRDFVLLPIGHLSCPLFPTRLYHTKHRETLGLVSPPPRYSSRSPDTLDRTVDTRFGGDQLTRGCLVAAGLVQLVSVVPFRVGPSDREAFRSS